MKKPYVLTKNREFQKVYRRGKYAATAFLVIYSINNNSDISKFGITTSRKVGNSVKRNRMRRLIKENLRQLYDRIVKGFDIVIVARKAETCANMEIIGKELRYLLHRLGLLDRESEC